MKNVMEEFWGPHDNPYRKPLRRCELALLNNEITPAQHHHNTIKILSEWLTCERVLRLRIW